MITLIIRFRMGHYVQTGTPNFRKEREMETILVIIKVLACVGLHHLYILDFGGNRGKYLKYKRE